MLQKTIGSNLLKKTNLLIVEDEEAIRDMLRFSLQRTHFTIIDVENTQQALRIFDHTIPDVIIVDWMLPGKSGIEFVQWVRKEKTLCHIPIIMLTAKAEEENKVKGLMAGADDYITKPFSTAELIARIKTVLRRGLLVSPDNKIQAGEILLDTEKNEVSIKNKLLELLPMEYKLLHFFMAHPNKTYTRNQLIDHIYGKTIYIDDRTIDVQIKRLRDKLRPYDYHHSIKTVRSVGYYFVRNDHEKRN